MTAFYKVSGAGNDFIALVTPEGSGPAAEPAPERIRAWCQRGLSIGADGLFLLDRLEAGAVRMRYFNADGGPADLCVNGTRCAARLAYEMGWQGEDSSVTVQTGAGPALARRLDGDEISLEMPLPSGPPEQVTARVDRIERFAWKVTVGVPHLVLDWDGPLAEAPVATLGAALRHHEVAGPHGANVHFVAPSERESAHLSVRSFERGVEGETLACGSGVLAVAAVVTSRWASFPVRALTKGGFVLTVDGEMEDRTITRWTLAGDARIVARGEIEDEASELPEAPEWR
jgi:diaminopimelate epimerase